MSSSETCVTRISKNLNPDDLHASKGFSEVQDLLVSGRYLESSESEYHSSESEFINSPTNLKINSQTVQSIKRSGSFSDSDNDGSSEKNLVRLDKHDPMSKFTSEATFPENILSTLDRKLSEIILLS